MSQNSGKYGKRNSVFCHPHPNVDCVEFKTQWRDILAKNPGINNLIRPDYQYNYYDPPHDETTAKFLQKLEYTLPFQRHKLLRRFLPQDLHQYKQLISKLPYAQLQQLREQIYIARIGDLGTNAPCTFSRRHWIYRLAGGNNEADIVTSETVKNLPTAELIRWYHTSINNLYADSAEEEYLRYKFCTGNKMVAVNRASLHGAGHYDPSDSYWNLNTFPPSACLALLPMVHDSHRYFARRINDECSDHFLPYREALISRRDLNDALIKYEKIQRCVIGREIRARVQSDSPTFSGAYQIFGRVFGSVLPEVFTNWIVIRDNPVVKYNEPDDDMLPVLNNINVPQIKPLLDELRHELMIEGKLSPMPQTTSDLTYQQQFNLEKILSFNSYQDEQNGRNSNNNNNNGGLWGSLSTIGSFFGFGDSTTNNPTFKTNMTSYDARYASSSSHHTYNNRDPEQTDPHYRHIPSDTTESQFQTYKTLSYQPAQTEIMYKLKQHEASMKAASENNQGGFFQSLFGQSDNEEKRWQQYQITSPGVDESDLNYLGHYSQEGNTNGIPNLSDDDDNNIPFQNNSNPMNINTIQQQQQQSNTKRVVVQQPLSFEELLDQFAVHDQYSTQNGYDNKADNSG